MALIPGSAEAFRGEVVTNSVTWETGPGVYLSRALSGLKKVVWARQLGGWGQGDSALWGCVGPGGDLAVPAALYNR